MEWARAAEPRVSAYRGVWWKKAACRWTASIRHDGRSKYLGLFDDERVAAEAYDAVAREQHGEWAVLNFTSEGERRPGLAGGLNLVLILE